MFEIELFICIKMDFALITYNGWFTMKTNQTKLIVSFSLANSLVDQIYNMTVFRVDTSSKMQGRWNDTKLYLMVRFNNRKSRIPTTTRLILTWNSVSVSLIYGWNRSVLKLFIFARTERIKIFLRNNNIKQTYKDH